LITRSEINDQKDQKQEQQNKYTDKEGIDELIPSQPTLVAQDFGTNVFLGHCSNPMPSRQMIQPKKAMIKMVRINPTTRQFISRIQVS
jgi:hypothetical protein